MHNTMIDIKSNLISFRKITEDIIYNLKNNTYNELSNLFDKRQAIIDLIENNSCDKDEFKNICSELEIQESETQLQTLMNQKHISLKKEIKKVSSAKKVNKNYNPNGYVDSIYFNKKI